MSIINLAIDKLFKNYIENLENSGDYKVLLDKQVQLSNKLEDMLTEEQNKVFGECQENHLEMEYCLSQEYFRAGVKTGIAFIIESIQTK